MIGPIMRLGIDFGTTHTVVAFVDRGNYPVVAFDDGNAVPSAIAIRLSDGALRFGSDAATLADDADWHVIRSFKRLLDDAGPTHEISVGPKGELTFPLTNLLQGYFLNLKDELVHRSNAGVKKRETLEAAVSIPANASSAQRFLTVDAFKRAGFEVVTVLNEPSAAGFEYAHRFQSAITSKREHVVVYDLGGGTFDASLIHMAERSNIVVTSAGVTRLGGDDFDETILDHVLGRLDDPIDDAQRLTLLDECRRAKEAVGANTRRFVVDLTMLDKPPLVIPMADIADVCAPLVKKTLDAMEHVVDFTTNGEAVQWNDIAGIYVVGGASSFPVVYRQLRERFGTTRVKRSPHPFAAGAIGLAIFLDEGAGYQLEEGLTRHFGVWREEEGGEGVLFDSIFPKDTPLPGPNDQPLSAVRRYRAAHNIGHFRYVECGLLKEGRPDGDLAPWDEIRFPFDPKLRDEKKLDDLLVTRMDQTGPVIEEKYECSAAGTLQVTVTVLDDGFSQTYKVARRSARTRRPGSVRGKGATARDVG